MSDNLSLANYLKNILKVDLKEKFTHNSNLGTTLKQSQVNFLCPNILGSMTDSFKTTEIDVALIKQK